MGAHTTAHIGKRLTVWLRDGSRFTAKLEAIRSRFYVFEGVGKVERKSVRTLCIAR
jgi:hypothetical protein